MSFASPAASAGVFAVIVVALATFTSVAGSPPTVTVAPAAKSVPLIVIEFPAAPGPEAGWDENARPCENSDVLPDGSVAVAVIRVAAVVATANVSSNSASPLPSVVTWVVPIQVSPSAKSRGNLEQTLA